MKADIAIDPGAGSRRGRPAAATRALQSWGSMQLAGRRLLHEAGEECRSSLSHRLERWGSEKNPSHPASPLRGLCCVAQDRFISYQKICMVAELGPKRSSSVARHFFWYLVRRSGVAISTALSPAQYSSTCCALCLLHLRGLAAATYPVFGLRAVGTNHKLGPHD